MFKWDEYFILFSAFKIPKKNLKVRLYVLLGADVIDTLPSLHPLVCLHSNVRQKAMDEFLQTIMEIPTPDGCDVSMDGESVKNPIRSLSECLSQTHIPV